MIKLTFIAIIIVAFITLIKTTLHENFNDYDIDDDEDWV
jgi:Flp pilus assembly pilin Flp